ncbi:MAG: hypothetical protein ACYCOS_02785 [Sulfobacillus sp.]
MATIYYDSDSSSTSEHSPQTFYIGKMGAHAEMGQTEVTIGPGTDFNTDAAGPAQYVYGYWWLGGPGADPDWDPSTYTVNRAVAWGQAQAMAAIAAASGQSTSKNGLLFSDFLNRTTIFADIEKSSVEPNHWLPPTDDYPGGSGLEFNSQCAGGFLGYLTGHGGWNCGVYSSQYEWEQIFGSASFEIGYFCDTGWAVKAEEFGGIAVVFDQYETSPNDYDELVGPSFPS